MKIGGSYNCSHTLHFRQAREVRVGRVHRDKQSHNFLLNNEGLMSKKSEKPMGDPLES